MARMAQCHAVIFVEPGPSFDERFDMVDFICRSQPAFLLAHNTEGIVSQIPRPEFRPYGIISPFARRSSPVVVEAAGVFVLVLVIITEAVGVRRRTAAILARSRYGFHLVAPSDTEE